MKQIGYTFAFLFVIVIIIPLILVRGCSQGTQTKENKTAEVVNKVKVYITDEDKVVEMNVNDYLKGVVAAEMPANFNIEALKAQAVAARTDTYYKIKNVQKSGVSPPEHKGADVCTNPAHCQAWISKDKAFSNWGILSAKKNWNKISSAVDDTTNVIMTYDAEPIDAVFHSTSSGKTENSEDVWSSAVPYLRSVNSEGDQQSPKYSSTVEVSLQDFKAKLTNAKPDIKFQDNGNLIEKIDNSEAGGVKTIRIGECDFKGTEIRNIFGLNSAHFTIEVKDNKVIFNVKGNGHDVGMSQYGANYLAQQGKNYDEILKHYYQGIELGKVQN